MWRVRRLLETHRVDCVIDIGANDGGFGSQLREAGYKGRIVSFEPLSEPFRRLVARSDADGNWTALRYAIGSVDGELEINVAGNDGASSSFLPMLESHRNAAPDANFIGSELVPMRRLDDLIDDLIDDLGIEFGTRIYLKLDVQGYEGMVLDGATRLTSSSRLVGLQLEMSFTALYEGGMTWTQAVDRAEGLGLEIAGIMPGFSDPNSGWMLQADGVFFRREP